MIQMIRIELYKIFRKWRSYIGLIAIFIITSLVQLAFYFDGSQYTTQLNRSLGDSFFYTGNLINGTLMAYLILQSLFIHIPFLIVLVGGDLMAGEAASGTFRLLVTRPVSRFSIVTSKYLAGIIYSVIIIFWLALISWGMSLLFYGSGDLFVIRDKFYIFHRDDVLWRFLSAYLYSALSMSVVMGLSFLFSTLVENSIGPIITSMAVLVALMVISVLPFDSIKAVKPWFFTEHFIKWGNFFSDPVDFQGIINSMIILVIYLAGFYLISLAVFSRKDILS